MIATAFPVGFFAGLFGIGGGLITVPFLFFIFEALGVDKDYLMHLAVGTSFAIIIPTSIVSVIDPFFIGTFKSTLSKTFLSLKIIFWFRIFFIKNYILLIYSAKSHILDAKPQTSAPV